MCLKESRLGKNNFSIYYNTNVDIISSHFKCMYAKVKFLILAFCGIKIYRMPATIFFVSISACVSVYVYRVSNGKDFTLHSVL